MAIRKVGFVGVRTKVLADMVGLFRDVLGVPIIRHSGDLVGFKLADGTALELYGPDDDFHAFFETGPVVAFEVDNFDEARAAMIAAGVDFIGDIQRGDSVGWQHFRAPDGTILEIIGPSAKST
jgi:catechol 2,3-dioxygenase-like lactoylglutathione lyase family enzyme